MLCFHAVQTGKHLLQTQNVSEQNQKHFLCPQQMMCTQANRETFVSATMCPHLLEPLRNVFATFYSFKADERRPSTGSSLYHTLYSSSSSSSESGSEESESEDEEEEEESEEGSREESESESEDESESESEEDEMQDGNKEEERLEVELEIEQPVGKDQEMVAVPVRNKQGDKS